MPVELGVWRIDEQLSRVPVAALDSESHLEGLLDRGIEIANPNWMLVGRRRATGSCSASSPTQKHLWPERRTNGIKQVCKWRIARPLPGRAARRAHPPKLGEVGLYHRCQLQLCKRLKFPIFLFDGLRPKWTRFS